MRTLWHFYGLFLTASKRTSYSTRNETTCKTHTFDTRGTFFERSCFTLFFFFSCCLKFFSTRIWFYWHNVTGFNQKLISCFFGMVNIQLSTQSLKLLKKKLVWWLLKMKKINTVTLRESNYFHHHLTITRLFDMCIVIGTEDCIFSLERRIPSTITYLSHVHITATNDLMIQ